MGNFPLDFADLNYFIWLFFAQFQKLDHQAFLMKGTLILPLGILSRFWF